MMGVFVSGKKAHGSCVRLYALSLTMWQDHDYWTLGAPSVTVTLSVNAIICLFSVLWKILTPFLFKCLIYFSTDNCSSRNINMKWPKMWILNVPIHRCTIYYVSSQCTGIRWIYGQQFKITCEISVLVFQ